MATHELTVKWNGKRIELVLGEGSTLGSLKTSLFEKTHVHPKRQKLLGLQAPGKTVTDDTPLGEFKLNAKKPIMMIGSSEEVIEETEKHAEVKYDVKDDFDVPEDSGVELELRAQPEVQERLQRRISKVEVKVLNPPRPGKRCLVLDIDYTLFDLGSSAETPEELARPYLHEFLTAAYADYDIIIWSATSMKWVATKMKELRVLDNPDYKLVCMLDSSSMLTVRTDKYGVFDCKPLAFIWAKFPEYYNENNTIMLDDLRRNYVLNVPQGLVIKPYRHAHRNRTEDRELLGISKYLQHIAQLEDWSGLDHRHWRSFHPRTSPQPPTQKPEG